VLPTGARYNEELECIYIYITLVGLHAYFLRLSNVRRFQHVLFQSTITISTLIQDYTLASIVYIDNHNSKELSYSNIKSIFHLRLNHSKNFYIVFIDHHSSKELSYSIIYSTLHLKINHSKNYHMSKIRLTI
jgi:hypothetical protein